MTKSTQGPGTRLAGRINRQFALLAVAALLGVCGCQSSIWNASDLIEWVKDQAVKQGCDRQSIELEDWYREEAGVNNWHGSCSDVNTGASKTFAINVDSVWKPSSSS